MDTTVVITTHNRHEGLKKLCFQLCNQTIDTSQFEVIVVDSLVGEDCSHIINAANSKGLNARLILAENVISAKRNAGALNSSGQLLIFLDDDMEITEYFVESHINAHSQSDEIVSGEILFPESWVEKSNYYRYKSQRHKNANLSTFSDSHRFTSMNFSIYRDDFLRSGGFDESFIGYGGEDVEFGIRTARNGFKHVKNREASAIHAEVQMSPSGFAKKIIQASNWMPNLINLAPESLSIKTIRLTEPLSERNLFEQAIYLGICILADLKFGSCLSRYLDKTDNLKIAYSPFLFKIHTLVCTKQGVNQRLQNDVD